MWHDIAGVSTAVVLAAIGALHLAWSRTPWPAAAYGTLGDYVYGGPDMPSKGACVVVGSGLVAGAYGLLAESAAAPELGPHPLYRFGVWTLTALLLARGLAGPLFSLRGSSAFRRWNLWLYSPLCVGLGAGAAAVAMR